METEWGTDAVEPTEVPSQNAMVASCHGLVTVDDNSNVIRLMHTSVNGFLISAEKRYPLVNEVGIADTCIRYQMLQRFAYACFSCEAEIVGTMEEWPFLAYAAREWGLHVLAADDPRVNELSLRFLKTESQKACSNQVWQYTRGRRKRYWDPSEANSCKGLHMAAMFGLTDIVKMLLRDCPVDEPTHLGTTALMKAASCGHPEVVKLLLRMKADPKKQNWYGTALHAAAEAGEVVTINELLDAGVEINVRDDHGRTPVLCAAESAQYDAMLFLLEKGADVNLVDDIQQTALLTVVEWAAPPSIIDSLLSFHANPNQAGYYGSGPLHLSAQNREDDATIALMLLEHGANINARGEQGRSALQVATAAENVNVMKFLLDHSALIDAQSNNGTTALYTAAQMGHVSAMQILLSHGANTMIADIRGFTPLHTVVKGNDLQMVQMLLGAGAHVDVPANDGRTPLDMAFEYGPKATHTLLASHITVSGAVDLTAGQED
ncbi:MAG: hypothetical protein Q9218_003636 [Villophora microphyllina]